MSLFFIDDISEQGLCARYQTRRKHFCQNLDAPALIIGLKEKPEENLTPWALMSRKMLQTPLMYHLTGLNQIDSHLLLNPCHKNMKTSLFLPKYDAQKARWDGVQLSYQSAALAQKLACQIGVDEIVKTQDLTQALVQTLKQSKAKKLYLAWYFPTKNLTKSFKTLRDHHLKAKQQLAKTLKRQGIDITLCSLQDLEWQERLLFDDIDLALAKTTQEKTKCAFEHCLKQLQHCKSETEVAGTLNGALEKESYLGKSFPSIVACGDNACTLHYQANNMPLKQHRLLLLDFGLQYHDIVSDISRTVPISGRFNPMQRCLYELVLDTQIYVESLLRSGAYLKQINQACWDYLNQKLAHVMYLHQGTFKLDYVQAPHQVSHLIKTAVHDGDPWREYAQRPLREGECISNEPGLYGYFDMTFNGQRYQERIGIRIEDNLLIQKNSVLNLSATIPKTVEAIESLMRINT